MFITRKRYEKEIRKKVKAAITQHDLEESCRQQDRRIKKMRDQVESLKATVDILYRRMNRINEDLEKQKEGSCKGFYQGQNGGYTIINGPGPTVPCTLESTMPEG